jgi:delta8-fatty-acid desaturase
MRKYQIGYVQGPWINFIPPIQGGKFRRLAELDSKTLADDDTLSSEEEDISRPETPLFDVGAHDEGLRIRRHISSTTSVSSLSDSNDEPIVKKSNDGGQMAFIDGLTRQEIAFDLGKYPPLDPDTQATIIRKYRELGVQLRERGLFECRYYKYGIELSRCSVLFGLSMFFLHRGQYYVSAAFLGCFWHQLVFMAHDAGHVGITHNYTIDTLFGIFISDFIGGLSLGWWKSSHNVHHIVTNSPEHDPDIELLPFFAVTHRLLKDIFSTYYDCVLPYDAFAAFVVPFQHLSYYPILAFGRFNLYFLSWSHLLSNKGPRKGAAWWHRYFEMVGQVFFWAWFGYCVVLSIPTWWDRVLFVVISHVVTSPIHVQITLSHYAMSTSDLGPAESFPQKMLRTTMDVACPAWLDFFHGGLQFQAVHHLFPRLPRHNLREAQQLVIEFCNEVEIPYALYGFVDGNEKVISRLADVGRQAAILAACQRSIVEKGDILGHHH